MNFQNKLIHNTLDCYIEKHLRIHANDDVKEWPQVFFKHAKNHTFFSLQWLSEECNFLPEDKNQVIISCYNCIVRGEVSYIEHDFPLIKLLLAIIQKKIWYSTIQKIKHTVTSEIYESLSFLSLYIASNHRSPLMYSESFQKIWLDYFRRDVHSFYVLNVKFLLWIKVWKESSYLLQILDNMIEIDPKNIDIFMHKIRVLWASQYRELGDISILIQAENIYISTLALCKKENFQLYPYMFFWYWNILVEKENYDGALSQYKIWFYMMRWKDVSFAEHYIFFIKILIIKHQYLRAKKYIDKLLLKNSSDTVKSKIYERSFLWKNFRFYIYLSIIDYFLGDIHNFQKNHTILIETYIGSETLAWNKNYFSFIYMEKEYIFQTYSQLNNNCDFSKKFMTDFMKLKMLDTMSETEKTISFLAFLFCLDMLNIADLKFHCRGIERWSFVYFITQYTPYSDMNTLDTIMDMEEKNLNISHDIMTKLLQGSELYQLFVPWFQVKDV